MNPDTLLWVCVPQRVAVDAGIPTLHLAIAVLPQLQSATVGAAGLGAWPPVTLGTAGLQVDVGPSGPATQTFAGTVHTDADPALWPLMFPPDTPVVSATAGGGDARALQVEPTASHARAAREVFEAAAAVSVTSDDEAGVARTALHAAVTGALARSPLARPDRGAAVRARTLAAQPRVRQARAAQPGARAATDPVPTSLPIAPDVHRTVALLREHPVVMRALGLVFDVTVPLPTPAELADLGVVRVRWPDAPPGLPTVVSPWTAYELDTARGKFLPQSNGTVSAGMLAISDATDADGAPDWSLTTLDVDLAVERLGQAADGVARAGDAAPVALPALRTGGISLLHGARADHLAARRERRDGQRALDATTMILHADDLVLGYRVDVRRGDGVWRSLCTRVATYTLGDAQPVGPAAAPEEGNVKAHAAVDDGDGQTLHTDEVVARWQGWSLAVPPPRFDTGGAGTTTTTNAAGRLAWTHDAPTRALPRLRFGAKYQLRARIADVAGGGLGVDDPLADRCATSSTIYERYEPVLAPAVTFTTPMAGVPDLGPGESAEDVVLRSDRDMSPEQFAAAFPNIPVTLDRALESPRVPLALIEQHGMLDRIADPAASWAIVRASAAPADPTRPLPLPDPAAAGLAAFQGRTPRVPQLLVTRPWPAWPAVGAKRARLTAGRRGDAPAMRWDATPNGDELLVTLAPGDALTVEVSSTMQEGFPDQFAARQFLSEDAKLAAADGRHPLLTPARTVRFVHAVRKPINDPAGAFSVIRTPDAMFATLVPIPDTLGVDAPSTARVDVMASWTEFTDDVRVLVRAVHVGGAALAPEGTVFDDPIRHEFGDTRHRVVTYTPVAASRHRHYFDPTGEGDDALFTAVSPLSCAPVHVPSAAPPAAPVVLATVPAFRWTDETDRPPTISPVDGRHRILQRRRESLLRVVLDRPWFSSGEGEQLAVILAASTPVAPEQRTVVSEIGRDPLWATNVPVRWPTADALPAWGPDTVSLSTNGTPVLAVPYDVWFAGGRWYADVEFIPDSSYSPLVRLAVARYQAHSIDGAALSPIVQAPFAPLLPQRVLVVERAGSTLYVRLEGVAPTGPWPNRISAVLETFPTTEAAATDVSASTDGAGGLALWQSPDAAVQWTEQEQDFGNELVIAIPPTGGLLRLVVRETEAIPSGDTMQVPAPVALGRRVVFVTVVPISTP